MKPPPVPSTDDSDTKNPNDAFETYHNIAETVGGLPSVRKKDNLIQGLAILVTTILGATAGGILYGTFGALGFGLGGMILGLILSGLVLMIVGWVRLGNRNK